MSDENNKTEKKEDSSSEKINYEYDSLKAIINALKNTERPLGS